MRYPKNFNKLKPEALQALQSGAEVYDKYKKENPESAFELESALNIFSAFPA